MRNKPFKDPHQAVADAVAIFTDTQDKLNAAADQLLEDKKLHESIAKDHTELATKANDAAVKAKNVAANIDRIVNG